MISYYSGLEAGKCQVSSVTTDVGGWLCSRHGYRACIAQLRIVRFKCCCFGIALTTSHIFTTSHTYNGFISFLGYCYFTGFLGYCWFTGILGYHPNGASLYQCIHGNTTVMTTASSSGGHGIKWFMPKAKISSLDDGLSDVDWSMDTF